MIRKFLEDARLNEEKGSIVEPEKAEKVEKVDQSAAKKTKKEAKKIKWFENFYCQDFPSHYFFNCFFKTISLNLKKKI